jgi:response regulator RpfG family c-di-GMP phosphodiesterase
MVTDINMPVMNGFELSLKIRNLIEEKKMPYISIIGNTANIVEEKKKEYRDFDEIFTKPFSKKQQIYELIEKVWHKRDEFSFEFEQIEEQIEMSETATKKKYSGFRNGQVEDIPINNGSSFNEINSRDLNTSIHAGSESEILKKHVYPSEPLSSN